MKMNHKTDLQWFNLLLTKARNQHDGHVTICKFTTNWRVGFFTPNSREDIDNMAVGETFADAASAALED